MGIHVLERGGEQRRSGVRRHDLQRDGVVLHSPGALGLRGWPIRQFVRGDADAQRQPAHRQLDGLELSRRIPGSGEAITIAS